MFLRMSDWEKMREHFNEAEKAALNSAITGETICPKGVALDEIRLGQELANKISFLKKEKAPWQRK